MSNPSKASPSGPVVLVTGATSGIGLEVARAFAATGARVIGTGRDQARLGNLAAEVDLALTLDVTDDTSVRIATAAVLDRYGQVDVLVNNAGIGLFQPWAETDIAAIEKVMSVNFYGAVRVARAFLPALIEAKGVLVQIASVAGRRGYKNHTAYCASKHALIGWSESLRGELAGTGASVVVVCPPAIRTAFFENAGYLTFEADHPGLKTMSPAEAGREIVRAAGERPDTMILSARARALDSLNRLSPALLRRVQKYK
ncbi:MAG: SDR family NAD(P)-dependent oxidoreductase [Myxococcales bacterium]|nr:SDR family NAD(P)-dependent oxidoreductase [Myxococcales bacterium]